MGDELPPLITRLTADIGGLADGLLQGKALVQAWQREVSSEFNGGRGIGESFGRDLAGGIQDAIPAEFQGAGTGERIGQELGGGIGIGVQDSDIGEKITASTTERLRDERGRFISAGQDIGAGLGAGMSTGVDPGLDDLDTKVKNRTRKIGEDSGKDAGQGFAANASPLMLGAFAAAATAGPGLILAGTAAAVLGAGALITKGNADLTGSYQALGQQASTAIRDATAPLIPALQGSLNILDEGIPKVGADLKGVFAAAAPEAQDFTRGLLSLANNALPGITTGLKAIQPESHLIADDLGKLGTGVGELFSGLATGAQGGAQGLDALITTAEHLLSDVGQITGSLSQGLGPALHDIETVALPVADGLTSVIKAFPPDEIRAAADATALLYGTFKAASLAGLVAEGTGFVTFLKEATTAEGALTLASGTAATAMGALGTAADLAMGPLGAIALAVATVQEGLNTKNNPDGGLAGVLKKTQAQHEAQAQAAITAANAESTFTTAIKTQVGALGDSADKSATATLAALGLTNGQDGLTTSLYRGLIGFNEARSGAQGYQTALQALNGTATSLDDAQNNMAQDLINLRAQFKQNGDTLDRNTQAGVSNREALSAAAKAAMDVATSQYQANGNMAQANKTLQDQENAIIKNTGATGKAKDAIKAYLDQLLQVPKDWTTNVHANVSPALDDVNGLVQKIDRTSAYVQIYASSNGLPGGKALLPSKDEGGFIEGTKNSPVMMIGHGQEYVLSTQMLEGRQQIDPRVLASLRSEMTGVGVGGGAGPAAFAGGGSSAGAGGLATVPVAVNVYIDGKKLGGGINSGVRANVQQFARYNAITGYAGNYQ